MTESNRHAFVHVLQDCLAIDRLGIAAYRALQQNPELSSLHTFAREMEKEEEEHVAGWQRLLELEEAGALPVLLAEPLQLQEHMQALRQKAHNTVEALRTSRTPREALDACYRLEVGMLHPAFETCFEHLRLLEPENRIDYETHLSRFVATLRRAHASNTTELLAETIEMLWHQTRDLARRNHYDILTGTLNRAGLFRALDSLAFLADRLNSRFGIIMVDIDHFKVVNDTHGHACGDAVLAAVASSLRHALRRSDLIGRLGGEEFVVLACPTDPSGLAALAEKLRAGVEATVAEGIGVTASFGVALSRGDGAPDREASALLKEADENLYQAKEAGRNRVVGP